MRFTISSEQLKSFHADSYLVLENLISEHEAASLLTAIARVRVKSPGYPEENLFRTIPLITSLAKKRGWGDLTYELLQKKPIRIAYDKFFHEPPILNRSLEENSCGLILDLSPTHLHQTTGFFFKNELPKVNLYRTDSKGYFFLLMTSKYLPEDMNPIIKRE